MTMLMQVSYSLFQVVDMAIVVEVISQLENYAITKEALEVMRNLNMT